MSRLSHVLGPVATAAGVAVRSAPGIGGAVAVSIGAGWLTERPAVGLIVGGLFALLLDRDIK